jgi:hypothetical protein
MPLPITISFLTQWQQGLPGCNCERFNKSYRNFAIYGLAVRWHLPTDSADLGPLRWGAIMHHRLFLQLPFLIVALCGAFWFSSAEALVRIHIDLSAQQMEVQSDSGSYTWPISSARSGYVTPNGSFAPERLERMHYSKKYHMSPMPYSIFFLGGYAIHGSYETAALGRPASHGCVRLSPDHAEILYHLVQAEGARISISGTPPASYAGGERYVHRAAAQQTDIFGFQIGPDESRGPVDSQRDFSW